MLLVPFLLLLVDDFAELLDLFLDLGEVGTNLFLLVVAGAQFLFDLLAFFDELDGRFDEFDPRQELSFSLGVMGLCFEGFLRLLDRFWNLLFLLGIAINLFGQTLFLAGEVGDHGRNRLLLVINLLALLLEFTEALKVLIDVL